MAASMGPEERHVTAADDQTALSNIMDLLHGFRSSQALFAAVGLGLFDVLDHNTATGNEGMTVAELAAACSRKGGLPSGISHDGMERLLNACVSLNLLQKQGSKYGCPAAYNRYLSNQSGQSLVGYVMHSAQSVYKLFGGLQQAVVKGGNVWQEVMGFSGSDIFSHMYNTDASLLRFMEGMHSFSQLSARPVLTAFDLSVYPRLADLGGATGAMMVTAAELYPELQCHVVDLPHVIHTAKGHFMKPPYVTSPALLERVHFVECDFFTQPEQLPDAELYVLSRILHDWEESKCSQLLSTIHQRLPDGGALLIAEMLLNDDKCGPPHAVLQSLNMLVQTNGRERSPAEYESMLRTAGYQNVQWQRTGSYLDAILAVK